MTPLAIKEIQPVSRLLDTYCILLRAMLQDELFEEQERAFVRNLLPDLNERFPSIFRSEFSTVWTLGMLNEVFNLEDLFEDGGSENLACQRGTGRIILRRRKYTSGVLSLSRVHAPLFES
jgi:hypothetical protein